MASLCLERLTDQNVDLLFHEFVLNDEDRVGGVLRMTQFFPDSITASWERFARRALQLPNRPGIVFVAALPRDFSFYPDEFNGMRFKDKFKK